MGFEVIGDALERKFVAENTTAREIANYVIRRFKVKDYEMVMIEDVQDWLILAIRMARGEEEIR